MKKTLITLITTVAAFGVFGQGAINFNNNVLNTVIAQVYGIDNTDPGRSNFQMKQGNSAAGFPVGTQVYGALGLGGAPSGINNGTNWTAQLFMGSPTATDDQLTPVLAATTVFRTITASAGKIINFNVSGLDTTANQRTQLRVWDNQGGTITSWNQLYPDGSLQNANMSLSQVGRGWSTSFAVTPTVTPTAPAFLIGLQSFQLFQVVPEPSVIALGVLGVGALLLFRRRKS